MRFNICVLPTSVHTQCFAEVADSIEWALKELEHEVSRGSVVPDATNILFGVRPDEPSIPEGSVIYNGEQVNGDGLWPACAARYRGLTVWDYSAANAARYAAWQLPAPSVVRPGYSPVLDGRIPHKDKTHDVVFFGSSNDRREKILHDLEVAGVSVLRVPFGVYGKERDELLAQARLCINIHYYDSAIFEAVRCSYLAQNGVPVVSELSVSAEAEQWGIDQVHYDDLVEFCCSLLSPDRPAILPNTAAHSMACAKRVSLLDDVRAAVAALEHPAVLEMTHDFASLSPEKQQAYQDAVKATLPPGTEITLSMIVKNEASVIERCLASVKPLLTRWCIVDTGSTDGTQEIIKKFMADLPGQLHERPWKEYDGSRTEAADLARAECKGEGWLLLIDADEQATFSAPPNLADGYDCYNAWITRCEGCTPWARPMFARANKRWYYVLPRHEGLYCHDNGPSCPKPLDEVLVLSSFEGARAKEDGYERFMKDAHVLEKWLAQNHDHFVAPRAVFYIAQSYLTAAHYKEPHDRAALQKATLSYLRRVEMAGFVQETFSACYQAAQCMEELGYPWERTQQTFLRAFSLRTTRAEPLFNIARHYRVEADKERIAGKDASGLYALAELYARRAAAIGPTRDHFPDVDHPTYIWRAKDELATALTWLSGHPEARDLNRHILSYPQLPPEDRKRIEENLAMCERVAPDPGIK